MNLIFLPGSPSVSLASLTIALMGTLLLLAACAPDDPDKKTSEYEALWEVVSNFEVEGRSVVALTIKNRSGADLGRDWTMYYNTLRLFDSSTMPPELEHRHINGDFFELKPTDAFSPLPDGQSRRFEFELLGQAIIEMDAPHGAYLVFDDERIVPLEIKVAPMIREEQYRRAPDDPMASAMGPELFEQHADLSVLPAESLLPVIPTPLVYNTMADAFELTARTPIRYEPGLQQEARFLARSLAALLGSEPPVSEGTGGISGGIQLSVGAVRVDGRPRSAGDEAYRLLVGSDGISIAGSDQAGVFYAIQSLRAMLPVEAWKRPARSLTLQGVSVEDAPSFEYRGLHLDVSRNFSTVEGVKKLLDVMAFYKLNKFHFHITDDEGWRLEIKAFPELVEIGGRRGHTLDEREYLYPAFGSGPFVDDPASLGTGWYTQQEYMELLRYAHERHIEVIPEIDVPGHARAALVAMKNRYDRLVAEGRQEEADRYRIHDPGETSVYRSVQHWNDNVINVCQESTYRFLRVIYDEIIDMHARAGAPLTSIHVGGDEVPYGSWTESPVCEALFAEPGLPESRDDLMDYFFARSADDLTERGLAMGAWEEFSLLRDPQTRQMTANPLFPGRSVPYVWSNIWGTGTEYYSYMLANAGYDIVMAHASNFYFDLAYQKHPEEGGLYWAGFVNTRDPFGFIPFDLYKSGVRDSRGNEMPESYFDGFETLTEEGRKHIKGLQGQLWGETMRLPGRIEYMALPRMIVLAQRAWRAEEAWMEIADRQARLQARDTAWNEFANRLAQRELPRLDYMNGGYGYRIPPVGIQVRDGMLHANVAYPGFEIRYTVNGSEPAASSRLYEGPARVDETAHIQVRAFDTRGRGGRISHINR